MTGDDVRSALTACPLFQDVARDGAALEAMAAICAVRRARPGEVVIAESSRGDELFVIREGRVRTEKRTPSQDPYTVRFQERGDFFGEMSLLDPDIRSATVIAEMDCEFVVVDRERFLAFGDRHPAAGLALTRRLAQRLAERLRQANEDVITLFSALVQESPDDGSARSRG
jgi:CRP-like cAMP-binding protein